MRLPVTVVGFGLVVIGSAILQRLRVRHLKEASESVSIDPSKEIVLRYAIWYYGYPLLGLILSALFAYEAWRGSPHPGVAMAYKIASLFCLVGAFFMLYRELTGRVRIADKKLIYTEGGDRREISADDVVRVSTNGFKFFIGLKWEKSAQIPATFKNSEIILAFLQRAAAKN
jgi:hypothetical protein